MKLWMLAICLLFIFSCDNQKSDYILEADDHQIAIDKMDLQYAYTILYVKNVPETIAFYKRALGFEQKLLTPENDYGEIESGSTTIAFANIELGETNFKTGFKESRLGEKPFGIELAFTTLEPENAVQRAVENGAVLLEAVVTKPWGQRVGYIRDLNGFIIEICTPIQNQE